MDKSRNSSGHDKGNHAKVDPTTVTIPATLKFFDSDKGFGFVTPLNGGADLFIHAKALDRSGIDPDTLAKGAELTVTQTMPDRQGRRDVAHRVELA